MGIDEKNGRYWKMKYEMPTLVYQEENCVRKHGKELAGFGTCALIITGAHSSKKNGALQDVCDALKEENRSYIIFDEIEENPSIETCAKAAALGMEKNADFCIGIGGGSPLDAAKAIALLMGNHTVETEMFYKPELAQKGAVPVVEVPTTAGTGSEVTPYAILTIHANHTKKSISHRIFPKLALCDAKYLAFAPRQILINTAVDALAHLVESYLNTGSNLYNRMFVEYGLKLWGQVKGKLQSDEVSDCYGILLEAATVAGMGITHTGTSLPHGLSYPVTYELGVAHGAACGLFLPGYLEFCEKAEGGKLKEDVKTILELLGLKNTGEFRELLERLLEPVTVPGELLESDMQQILQNPAKLKNVPVAVTEEDLRQSLFGNNWLQ